MNVGRAATNRLRDEQIHIFDNRSIVVARALRVVPGNVYARSRVAEKRLHRIALRQTVVAVSRFNRRANIVRRSKAERDRHSEHARELVHHIRVERVGGNGEHLRTFNLQRKHVVAVGKFASHFFKRFRRRANAFQIRDFHIELLRERGGNRRPRRVAFVDQKRQRFRVRIFFGCALGKHIFPRGGDGFRRHKLLGLNQINDIIISGNHDFGSPCKIDKKKGRGMGKIKSSSVQNTPRSTSRRVRFEKNAEFLARNPRPCKRKGGRKTN